MARRAEDYRRIMSWGIGDDAPQQTSIGSQNGPAEQVVLGIGLLRIGYAGDVPGNPVSVVVQSADGGTQWGSDAVPIDVPLAIVVEEPVLVLARPAWSHADPIQLRLALTPIGAPSDRLYATRTVVLAPGGAVVLPQWVRGVSVLSAGSFSFLDRAGAPLNSAALTGAWDRPAAAVSITSAAGATLVLYY